MKRSLISIAVVAALAGCANLDGREPTVVRVIEYGAGGGMVTPAQVGGCSVAVSEGKPAEGVTRHVRVDVIYAGDRCSAKASQ